MKIIFFILFLASCAYAQDDTVLTLGHRNSHSKIDKLFPAKLSGISLSNDSIIVIGGGSGTFENWSATDAGSPVLAPSVTAGTKGIAIGDSVVVTGANATAAGTGAKATGEASVAIGGKNFTLSHNAYTKALGHYATAVGTMAVATSIGSTVYGYSAGDFCTYDDASNILGGGNNTVVGGEAEVDPGGGWDTPPPGVVAPGSFNTITGWASNAIGSLNQLYGDGTTATGIGNSCYGNNVGHGLSGIRYYCSLFGYSQDGNLNSAFDSVVMFGAGILTARNTAELLFGTKNTTATNMLAVFADGGKDGNPSTFDALEIAKDGTVKAGKAFQVGGFSIGRSAWTVTSALGGGFGKFVPANLGFTTLGNTSFGASATKQFATIAPFSGTIRNFYASSATSTSDGTDTIFVYKNGAVTTVLASFSNGAGTANDQTHNFTFVAGDYISVYYKSGGNLNDWETSMEVDAN